MHLYYFFVYLQIEKYSMTMKKTVYYLLFIILLCIHSCKTPAFIEKESITFETGFPIQEDCFGLWYDSKTKKESIYFATYIDSSYVRFFTLDGKKENFIQDIPLTQVCKELIDINTITVYDLDTVICIDGYEHTNRMVFLNRKGEKYYTMNFDTIKGPMDDLYWILRAYSNNTAKPYIYLSAFYKWRLVNIDSIVVHNSNKQLTRREISIKNRIWHFKKLYEIPSVYRFNVQNGQYTYSNPRIYTYFTPVSSLDSVNENTCIYEQSLSISYANKVFVWGKRNNKILVLNPKKLQVEKCFQLDSKYTEITTPDIPLKDIMFYKKISDFYLSQGQICNVLFDAKTKYYYIVERHKLPFEDYAFLSDAAFSIHIYDKNFKKLGEQYFEEGKYDFRFIILTSKGLYIAKNENSKDYDPEKVQFFRFEIK